MPCDEQGLNLPIDALLWETQEEESIVRLLSGWEEYYFCLRTLFQLLFDIEGALEAGQFGLAVEQARTALHAATEAKLVRVGGPRRLHGRDEWSSPTGHLSGACRRWQLVVEVWGREAPLVQEMWALERELPSEDDECIRYVSRCKELVRQHIGLRLEVSPDALLGLLYEFFSIARLLATFGYGSRDKLRIFGLNGYREVREVDPYEYVSEYVASRWKAAMPNRSQPQDGKE